MGRVLLVDDDPSLRRAFGFLLGDAGHELQTASSAEAAFALAVNWEPEVVILDVHLPGMTGLEAIEQFRRTLAAVPVIMITGESSMEIAVEAARRGSWEYRTKPVDPDELLGLVTRALDARSKRSTAGDTPPPGGGSAGSRMVGQGRRMQEVYRTIGRVAPTDATVLIRGESGTGKELVAQAIHHYGADSQGPLVVVNCVAIPEALLESELFGHERGAFTGAVSRRPGKFELASGGTILLDEIGDLPLGLQGKILRVLQERTFDRVGGGETLRVRARILAATNRDLEDAMKRGSFREDLYHRLNVVTVTLPPLRERKEDLPALVQAFVARFALELGCESPAIPDEAMAVLQGYSWPGNVRELEHCLKSAMVLSRGYALQAEDLRRCLRTIEGHSAREGVAGDLQQFIRDHIAGQQGPHVYDNLVAMFESLVLREAMRQSGGRQAEAARLLGMPRPTLHAKLQRHGIRTSSRVEPADAPGESEQTKA